MKTIDELVTYKSKCITGRDVFRLSEFIPENRFAELGVKIKPEFAGKHAVKALTKENIMEELKRDELFGWEKCQHERGLSANEMAKVVEMWDWVLGNNTVNTAHDCSNLFHDTFVAISKKYNIELPQE